MNSTLMDDLEGFKTSVKDVTAYVVEEQRTRKVEPENVTELVYIITKLEWMKSCFI